MSQDSEAAESSGVWAALARRLPLQARVSIGLALATTVFAAVYIDATAAIVTPQLSDPVGPKAFPYLISAALLVCAAGLFVEGLVLFREPDPAGGGFTLRDPRWRIAAGVMGWTLLYFLAFNDAGYLAATAVFLFGLIFVFDGRRVLRSALVAVVFSGVSYVAFNNYLDVFLPGGPFLK